MILQDLTPKTYCDGLYKKIFNLTNRIFIILTEAFTIKKDSKCDINPDIQKKAALLKRQYKFRNFNESASS